MLQYLLLLNFFQYPFKMSDLKGGNHPIWKVKHNQFPEMYSKVIPKYSTHSYKKNYGSYNLKTEQKSEHKIEDFKL